VRRWNLREIETPAGRRSPVVLHSGDEARAVLVTLEPGEELGVHQVKENAFVTPVEGTLYEFGQIAGPAAPCTAPLAKGPSTPDLTAATDSGASATDDVTNVASRPSPGSRDSRRPARPCNCTSNGP